MTHTLQCDSKNQMGALKMFRWPALLITAGLGFGLQTSIAVADGAKYPPARDMLFWNAQQQSVAYKHFEEIYASRKVPHGSDVLHLPKGRPLQVSFTENGARKSTDDFIKENRAFGLLVINKGKIRIERYANGLTPKDRWTSFSVVKSVVSTLVAAAVKDGKIKSIDDKISLYIPEAQNSGYKDVTIRQVLNMSSGVKWDENYLDRDSDTNFIVNALADRRSGALLQHQLQAASSWPPDSKFDYNSGNTHLLGILVARVTGQKLSDYLSEKIWKPAGMESDAAWIMDGEQGQEFAGCCLNATLRDFGRFGLFALNGGTRGTYAAVPAGWFEEATKGSPASAGYSFQWWLPRAGLFRALGVFGQTIAISKADDTVIVILSTWPKPVDPALQQLQTAYIEAVLQAVRAGG